MNCVIVDDDQIASNMLKQLISIDSTLTLVGQYSDAIIAYNEILTQSVDVIFLDIELRGMCWIGLSRNLNQKMPKIIFTTTATAYKIMASDINVVDLLTKPISPEKFMLAIEKARIFHKTNSQDASINEDKFVFIRDANVVKRLKTDDILYIEATGDKVKIHITDHAYVINSSLKTIEQKLPQSVFLRTHRSFIINLSKIDTMQNGTLIINRNRIPVSDAYRSLVNKRMCIL